MTADSYTPENLGEEGRLRELVLAILFVSSEALSTASIRSAVGVPGVDGNAIRAELESLADDLESRGSGIRLIQVAGGWQLRTDAGWAPWVRRFTSKRPIRLSRSAVECLAIIAYRQPATRYDVEQIRGVDSGGPIRTLLERNMLRILGRKDEPGRPMLYGTTQKFLEIFGLQNLNELPSLKEFSELEPEDFPSRAAEALQGVFEQLQEDAERGEAKLSVDASQDEGLVDEDAQETIDDSTNSEPDDGAAEVVDNGSDEEADVDLDDSNEDKSSDEVNSERDDDEVIEVVDTDD